MPTTAPTYHLRKTPGKPQPYYWNVTATNGRELARSSETYARKDDAIRSANLIRESKGNDFWDETGEK